MAGTNNFLVWNPTAANQETDTAYAADTQRSGGAASGSIFPSPTANKLFYQCSSMITALAQMMANKNYNMSDANQANLIAALTNIVTKADTTSGSGSSGYWEKSPTGRIVQWGLAASTTNRVTVTFPTPFSSAGSIAIALASVDYGTGATRNVIYLVTAPTTTTFQAGTDSSSCAFTWQAMGY